VRGALEAILDDLREGTSFKFRMVTAGICDDDDGKGEKAVSSDAAAAAAGPIR